MNLRAVGWLLGCVLLLLAGFELVPAGVAIFYGEGGAARAFVASAAITALLAGALLWPNRRSTVTAHGRVNFYRREGLAVVGLSWLLAGAAGAVPFVLSGELRSPIDAFFESASGFTTTGSTILTAERIDALPKSIAFWRSFTHWLGGIGIVLVFVVVFPTGGRSLFRSEVPGIAREAMQQRVRDSALALVRVYIVLTAVAVGCLMFAGLSLYEATIHAFSTLATGGFSSHSSSIAYFESVAVELVIVVFMFAAGVNFTFYDAGLRLGARRTWQLALGSTEFRTYCGLIAGATAVLAAVLWFWGGSNGLEGSPLPDYSKLGLALRDSVFTVVSLHTSTGFGTADFDSWPDFCRVLCMFLAVIGACAGSTGGGIKVVRFLILARASVRGIAAFARPRAIHTVRLDGRTLDEGMVSSVIGYCGLWVLVLAGGTLALSAMNVEPLTAGTSVLATLNNIGPGLSLVGPTAHFGWLPDLGKLLLSLLMIVGRLEFYAIVVLLLPRFWRH